MKTPLYISIILLAFCWSCDSSTHAPRKGAWVNPHMDKNGRIIKGHFRNSVNYNPNRFKNNLRSKSYYQRNKWRYHKRSKSR